MRALLDVNFLVALFDRVHIFHEAAHAWFAAHRQQGWASCPLTENGLVRVVSNPKYPGGRTTVQDALDRLAQFRSSGDHEFWPDSVSLCDRAAIDWAQLAGPGVLTDAYLLSLSTHRGGRLVTFDHRIPLAAVRAAREEHLVLVPA